ncbi:hypothetical protein Dtox_1662 [Desulfofarcimen acetoxidans DSM 771]|jgi:hypothetical protein|uniref:Uncharacterized protein n=1 Tax=Desulfofarcimen acetoxidans (strain ATCC 49208 / DSM 771 / KCTC 5769 / VKM B-1644 / 5575) TaxID=485916 RepID=C8VWG7_DESAS|nr:hypothetical protein [Desulfofarcimen acetoxidans]ACV62519.1 hypothetical protein Dtox_1662 [Desulfofarcimen acetoxidans DSM 771]
MGDELSMSQYNLSLQENTQKSIMAIKKLNEALTAFDRSLCGINTSIKNFQHLAKDLQKYKL